MNILFIHQNFPGQYKNLAPALAKLGHDCVALTLRVSEPSTWRGVKILPYAIARKPNSGMHPWLVDLNSKLHRGEACMQAALKLKEEGYTPDVIVAHPGWGESLFLRDVWPTARIGLYYELFYQADAGDSGFDDEFSQGSDAQALQRIRMKNINNFLHYPVGDLGISPTKFQASSFPKAYQDRISIIHDGIDTDVACPDPLARLNIPNGPSLTRSDEVITFVNRNLEPYRGFHIFMRALPQILRNRPKAKVVIVGGDGSSYGAAPPAGRSWKEIFVDEVRAKISDQDWQRVHFTGKLPYDQFLNVLKVSRAHVYLTYPFVLSWSLLEAMSCGAPIIASDTAPVREVIAHGKNGSLVDFFDPATLAFEVQSVLENEARSVLLGEAARKKIKKNYDLKSICLPRQIEWIEQLAQMKAGGAELFP